MRLRLVVEDEEYCDRLLLLFSFFGVVGVILVTTAISFWSLIWLFDDFDVVFVGVSRFKLRLELLFCKSCCLAELELFSAARRSKTVERSLGWV